MLAIVAYTPRKINMEYTPGRGEASSKRSFSGLTLTCQSSGGVYIFQCIQIQLIWFDFPLSRPELTLQSTGLLKAIELLLWSFPTTRNMKKQAGYRFESMQPIHKCEKIWQTFISKVNKKTHSFLQKVLKLLINSSLSWYHHDSG